MREEYLLNHLERKEMRDLIRFKALTDFVLASGIPVETLIDKAFEGLNTQSQMTLPYLEQKVKIEKVEKLDHTALLDIKKRLAAKKEQQQAQHVSDASE